MSIFRKRKQGESMSERRRYPRRRSDGTQVHLYAEGISTQCCKVRDISKAGIFIQTGTPLPLAQFVELAFTCLHSRQIVKIYRRSAYVARTSEDGVVVLFFDRRIA